MPRRNKPKLNKIVPDDPSHPELEEGVEFEVEIGEEPPLSKAVRDPRTKLPDRTPQLTAARCYLSRARDPIVAAFLAAEGARKEGTRKMSRKAWDEQLTRFKGLRR